jgi:PKD repeat protein
VKTGYITATALPVSSYAVNSTIGTVPLSVLFNDTSSGTPTAWNWSFGDGNWTNGTTQNVTHVYSYAGSFSAFLLSSNAAGSNQSAVGIITVNPSVYTPVASFTKNRAIVRRPMPVIVTDNSTNTPTQWNVSWGDGAWSNSTTSNTTSHSYSRKGYFKIYEITGNTAGTNQTPTQTIYSYANLFGAVPGELPSPYMSCTDLTYSVSRPLSPLEQDSTEAKIFKICSSF